MWYRITSYIINLKADFNYLNFFRCNVRDGSIARSEYSESEENYGCP